MLRQEVASVQQGISTVLVVGGTDRRGLMYALLELSARILSEGDVALTGIENLVEFPDHIPPQLAGRWDSVYEQDGPAFALVGVRHPHVPELDHGLRKGLILLFRKHGPSLPPIR